MDELSTTAEVDRLCEPGIWLRRTPSMNTLNRLGGLPDLPSDLEWPRNGEGLPLHFLAQLNLSELPSTPLKPGGPALPSTGMLYFFAFLDEELIWSDDPRSTRVLYSATPAFAPCALPADIPDIGTIYPPDGTTHFPAAPLSAFVIDTFHGQSAFSSAREAFTEVQERVIASVERATGAPIPIVDEDAIYQPVAIEDRRNGKREFSMRQHVVLGAPYDIQGTAGQATEDGLICLLQIDTDWGLHKDFQFCDMGMAQFWISPQDLRDGRFDRAWATTEGG